MIIDNAIRFHMLRPTATLPTYATRGSLCFDLYAALPQGVETVELKTGEILRVGTGLQFQCPLNFGVKIYARSGLASIYGVVLANGVGIIDNDYTGEVEIALTLLAGRHFDSYVIRQGDRIAQGELSLLAQAPIVLTPYPAAGTERNAGGFGSTGA